LDQQTLLMGSVVVTRYGEDTRTYLLYTQHACDSLLSLVNCPSVIHSLMAVFLLQLFLDAENFEPRDVKPAQRHQWDGEDVEQDTAVDVRTCFQFC